MQRLETAARPGPWKGPRTAEEHGNVRSGPASAPIVRLGPMAGDFYTSAARPRLLGPVHDTRMTVPSSPRAAIPRTCGSLDPKDRDQVYGPGQIKAAPCDEDHVVGLASLSISDALVICSNGSAMVTSDSGDSWEEADQLPGHYGCRRPATAVTGSPALLPDVRVFRFGH